MNPTKLVSKILSVFRFAGIPIIGDRLNIAEHSYEVSLYATKLARQLLKDGHIDGAKAHLIVEHAVLHDIPETMTGDIPYPVKSQYPQLKEILDKIEEDITFSELSIFPIHYDTDVLFIVKLCDLLAVFREMSAELDLGNYELNEGYVKSNCLKILETAINKYKLDTPAKVAAMQEIAFDFMSLKSKNELKGILVSAILCQLEFNGVDKDEYRELDQRFTEECKASVS